MKILALVAARGGSKRLPGKNVRLLGGLPLIEWSINSAKGFTQIVDILVSTDDIEIATICKAAGAYVPWLRPGALASDSASSVDVALHALDWYESEKGPVDGLLLLQPTSPFRSSATIQRSFELFEKHGYRPVLGVSKPHEHPMWAMKLHGEYLIPFIEANGLNLRSQDLPAAYVVNGSIYLITPEDLRNNRSFHSTKTVPVFVDSQIEALDIDTEFDWRCAVAHLADKSTESQLP